MAAPLATRARAKVNLTLRVLGRRTDGYHELESLVAFAGVGDALSLEPAAMPSLTISGPFGHGLDSGPGNLVLRAVDELANLAGPLRSGHFHLVKRLPVASGIGGGSADAAAALRLLARLNGIATDAPELLQVAARLGADVPVCLTSQARMMAGIGEWLGPPVPLPRLFAVLVNPGVPVATRDVFAELGLAPGSTRAARSPIDNLDAILAAGNDLAPSAQKIAPVIADVLAVLAAQPGCTLARMSGSGATCFGLFGDCRDSAGAAKAMTRANRHWWVKPTILG